MLLAVLNSKSENSTVEEASWLGRKLGTAQVSYGKEQVEAEQSS